MFKKITLNTVLSVLVVLLAMLHANFCLRPPLVGSSFLFTSQLLFIGIIFRYKKTLCPVASEYKWLNYFLAWSFLEIVAGFFIAENSTERRQLLVGGISLMIPILAWVFYKPDRFAEIFHFFFKYAWIPYLCFFIWQLGLTQFYYSPLLLLFLFYPLFPQKRRIVVLVLAVVYIASVLGDARSQSYKGLAALFFGSLLIWRHRLPSTFFKLIHKCGFLLTLGVFALVLTDSFQVIIGGERAVMVEDNNLTREMGKKDTRSLLYIDIFESSTGDGFATVLLGKTPARGFKIRYSGTLFVSQYMDGFVFNKGERHKNEMVLSNIYIWTGLIGLILFSLIYYRGSFLAVVRSRNRILPVVGCFVAFRWTYGWIEDVNNFLIMDVDLWALIGMCYSDKFRNMSEEQMILWVKSLLSTKYKRMFIMGKYKISQE